MFSQNLSLYCSVPSDASGRSGRGDTQTADGPHQRLTDENKRGQESGSETDDRKGEGARSQHLARGRRPIPAVCDQTRARERN